MQTPIHLETPLDEKTARALKCGDSAEFTGVIYTARDAAHARFQSLLERGEPLPIDIEGAVIYYVGPTPARPGEIIGSAGPTTSSRMDLYTPALLRLGLRGMIGKGLRSPEVVSAMKETGAVYFGAIGGAGALLASRVESAEVAAFPELGPEAVYRLFVRRFPVTVAVDSRGEDLYTAGQAAFAALSGNG